MGRDYLPGDVAMVNGRVCINKGNEWEHGDPRAFPFQASPDLEIHPLVVIDLQDEAQVERLRARLESMSFSPWACGATSCLTTALREFANPTPPKPDEPTGLGAVVEDVRGDAWVRVAGNAISQWHHGGRFPQQWRDLDVVRVLSEGIS